VWRIKNRNPSLGPEEPSRKHRVKGKILKSARVNNPQADGKDLTAAHINPEPSQQQNGYASEKKSFL